MNAPVRVVFGKIKHNCGHFAKKRLSDSVRFQRLPCVGIGLSEKTLSSDIVFMKEALELAKCAFVNDEVPIGALIVHENEIISQDYNRTESSCDPTAHAELLCIRDAAKKFNNWRLHGCTLYVTLEPCSMCAGAILQSRMDRVVYGASSPLVGACGSWINLFQEDNIHAFHTNIDIVGGVCEAESRKLLQSFYKQRRTKK